MVKFAREADDLTISQKTFTPVCCYNSIIAKENEKTNKEIRHKIAEIRHIVDTINLIWYNNCVFLKGGRCYVRGCRNAFFQFNRSRIYR